MRFLSTAGRRCPGMEKGSACLAEPRCSPVEVSRLVTSRVSRTRRCSFQFQLSQVVVPGGSACADITACPRTPRSFADTSMRTLRSAPL